MSRHQEVIDIKTQALTRPATPPTPPPPHLGQPEGELMGEVSRLLMCVRKRLHSGPGLRGGVANAFVHVII